MVASASGAHECDEPVAKLVGSLGVEKSEILETSISRATSGEGGLQGYKAWVRLKFCLGYLVIDMDAQCRSSQEYVNGACKIKGLPNY